MQDSFKDQQRDFYLLWSQVNIIYSRWADRLGVPYDTLITLYGLDIHGCMTQKNICDFYGFPKQTVNGIIRRLKNDGYISLETNPADKREKLVSLTDSGSAYAKELLAPLYQAEQHTFSEVGGQRLSQMLETIDLFNNSMKKFLEGSK